MRIMKPVAGVVVLVGLYAAAGYIGVPYGVRWAVDNYLSQALGGRNADVKNVSFNPWTWQLDVEGLSVESANRPQNHILDLQRLSTKVNFATLTNMAPIVDYIDVAGLHVQLTANEQNNKETAAKVNETSAATESGLPAFSLSNIRVTDSSVRFTNPKAGASVNITDIDFALPVVSTLPTAAENAVTPKLSLKINGQPVTASGKATNDAASLALNIADLDIAALTKAVPVTLPVDVRSARLTTSLDLDFTMPKNGVTGLIVKGTIQAKNVDVRADGGKTRASVQNISTNVALFDLAKKRVEISRVEVIKPALTATIASQSTSKSNSATTSAPAATPSNAAWSWSLAQAEISGGSVKLTDTSMKPAASLAVDAIALTARDFSSKNGATGTYRTSAKVAGGSLTSEGKLTLMPLAVNATTNIKALNFAPFNPWVKSLAGAQLTKGTADVTGKLDMKSGKKLALAWAGDFAVDNLEAKNAAGKTLMTWKETTATSVKLNSIDPVNLTIKDLIIKEPAQKLTQTTSSVLGVLGRIAKATGHENTARRMTKAEETITKDIHIKDLVYGNGRFNINGKGTDSLQLLAVEALNKVFARSSKK